MDNTANKSSREAAVAFDGVRVYRRSEEQLASMKLEMAEIWKNKPLYYKFIKRTFDVVASCVALVVLSPILIVTSVAILADDGWPIIFSQYRSGKDMKKFMFYKFRSMYKDAPERLKDLIAKNEQTGPAFKIKNDPRITKCGQFIRRYSIDELPQLVNIIKGDMSIVGPRPILDFQMEAADRYDQQRMAVRPGLTCYWQIGGRANVTWDEWVQLDFRYIRDMSLWTDLKIILKTIPAIFKGAGAF